MNPTTGIQGALAASIATHADREALVFGASRWSYAELQAAITRTAALLARQSLRAGDRVMLAMANHPGFVFSFFALQHLGCTVVPVDVRLTADELHFLVGDADVALVVCDEDVALKYRERFPAPAGPSFFSPPAEAADDLAACAPQPAAVAGSDIAVILYTSGTTGAPKGACLSHDNLLAVDRLQRAHLGLGLQDRVVTSLPLTHVAGLVCGVLTPLLAGASVLVLPRFDTAEFLAAAERHRMTYTLMVPTMYNLCLLRADFRQYDLSTWRVGHYGAAPMPDPTIDGLRRALPQLRLVSGYGSTELAASAIMMPIHAPAEKRFALGQPLPGVEIRIVDPVTGADVPRGEEGELWVRSPGLMRHYWRRDAATAEAVVDGYWRSGDIVRQDEDGYLYLMDRLKDMINRAGYKVFPAQVESVLAQHGSVAEAAVVGRPDPVLGERVHAFVRTLDGQADAEALREFCARQLSDFAVPESFTLSAEPLPRTSTGKLDKKQLRAAMQAPDGAPR